MNDLYSLITALCRYDMSWHTIVEVLMHHKAAESVSYERLCDLARIATEARDAAEAAIT